MKAGLITIIALKGKSTITASKNLKKVIVQNLTNIATVPKAIPPNWSLADNYEWASAFSMRFEG
ncbi:MAG: hypothetical protein QW320_08805 [Ignisphaera sp.]